MGADLAKSVFAQQLAQVLSVAFSPDGHLLATGDANGEIRLWQVIHLDNYANKYESFRMERKDGVLEVALHTNGGSMVFSKTVHDELGFAFADIAADRENKVVILTGTGDKLSQRSNYLTFSEESSHANHF